MANQWYPFYPGDYSRDTGHLTLLEHGAYRLLLDHYYANGGPLSLDHDRLFTITKAFSEAGQKATLTVVEIFFYRTPEGYINHRADKILSEQEGAQEKRKSRASKGAAARWGKTDEKIEKTLEMLQASKKDASSIENGCLEQCLSNATTTTTIRTLKDTTSENPSSKIDDIIRAEIEKRRPFIRSRFGFSDSDIEIEVEEILIKCRARSPGPDIWLYLSQWFKNRRDAINAREKTRQEKQGGILGWGDSRRDGFRGAPQGESIPGFELVDKSGNW